MTSYWNGKTRDELWEQLLEVGSRPPGWDIIVIGGGITGAGILHEASRLGLDVALVEQKDFAWGTSSRSSKMIHGGLRYLASGDFRLSRDSVKERNRLLLELPGLVDPLGFLLSHYRRKFPGPISFNILLAIYDFFAGQWNHRFYPKPEYLLMAPRIKEPGLRGGTRFVDGVTDDARLVLRLIQDSVLKSALALNYVEATELLMSKGVVRGIVARDSATGQEAEVFARAVINASGAWTDRLRTRIGGGKDIRPLRGSHLVFPIWRLPVAQAITLMHPEDHRPVFIFPWEGATVVGTTDLDHSQDLNQEPRITEEEVRYLLAIVEHQFPSLAISRDDVLSTFSGIRPVVHMKRRGKVDPSKERREHSIWEEKGLISIGGGKLTTYRLVARDALKRVIHDPLEGHEKKQAPFEKSGVSAELHSMHSQLGHFTKRRLRGRYGSLWPQVISTSKGGELQPVPGTNTLWTELRWAARNEGVVHLDDLLMRRTRLGITLREGGLRYSQKIKAICQEELDWDENEWEQEFTAYKNLWHQCYSIHE